MLAKKKPTKQKNIIMIIVLLVCFGAIAYMLLGQEKVIEYEDITEDNLLSPGFMQVRKMRKIDQILESLDVRFVEYNIYKRMKGGVSLPEVEDDDIGNNTPFRIKEFIPKSF